VLADIPGLIEGAHEGVGIGDRFLGHVERCRVLLHLVDGAPGDMPARPTRRARRTRSLWRGLADKPEIVALSQIDTLTRTPKQEESAAAEARRRPCAAAAVAVTGEGRRGGAARADVARSRPRAEARRKAGGEPMRAMAIRQMTELAFRLPPHRRQDRLGAAGRPRAGREARMAGLAGRRYRRARREGRREMCWSSRPAPSRSAAPSSASAAKSR
jgi:hypothetical protein